MSNNDIQLTDREVSLLNILSNLPNEHTFEVDWLFDEYFQPFAHKKSEYKKQETGRSSIRASMASLGLKLAAAGVGSIRRIEGGRGRGRKGVYLFTRQRNWQLKPGNMLLANRDG